MLEYIYICRHGFRTSNATEYTPTGIRLDHPLTVYGHEQARDLGAFLSNPEVTAPHPVPELIVSSPFFRCVATAAPTARALNLPIAIDHGVAEWYPPALEGTGLHPRPARGGPADIVPFFPDLPINMDYASTVFPSRKGESMPDLYNRIDTFVDAWIGRMDAAGVRTAVIFAHAATVITLGRALTGDRHRDFTAGCATTSLYRRRGTGRIAGWDCVYTGKADYMPGGVERDWDFGQVELPNGEVVPDEGDYEPHTQADLLPVGLAAGMEQYQSPGFEAKHKLPLPPRPRDRGRL